MLNHFTTSPLSVRVPEASAVCLADKRLVLVSLTERGTAIVLADRRRRDHWLAQRLRELTPDERAVLREAAPILERLATTD